MTESQMLLSLQDGVAPVHIVGGKAASLMKLYSSKIILETATRYLPERILVPQRRSKCSSCCCCCFSGLCMETVGYKIRKGLTLNDRAYFMQPNFVDKDQYNHVECGRTFKNTLSNGWLAVQSAFAVESKHGISKHVPRGFALSVVFFQPWIDKVMESADWRSAEAKLLSHEAPAVCEELKRLAKSLPLFPEQEQVLQRLQEEIGSWPGRLAAVRSSAPEEDGTGASFAGVFETKLGVTAATLEHAVRECFASVFDHRVFSYAGVHRPAFAAVVMEMVNSHKAGVAFSANPLNSDLDEMLVDSSWGLGESVVDGSIVADRFIWDKVSRKIVHQKIGSKVQERCLLSNGGVSIHAVDDARKLECTLSESEMAQLGGLVSAVEAVYDMPMDTEWAFAQDGELKLLQARPITTVYPIDPDMLTQPGERRVLYYDPNIASEATTTSPFTHMDITVYVELCGLAMGMKGLVVPEDPSQMFFNGATRQYLNYSHILRFPGCNSEVFANEMELLDAYLTNIFRGGECDDKRYRSERLPEELTCSNVCSLMRKVQISKMWKTYKKFKNDPVKSNAELVAAKAQFVAKLKELTARGPTNEGLYSHMKDICESAVPVLDLQMGAIPTVLQVFKSIDVARRKGKTEEEKQAAEALLGGFEGDPLMEMNIDMYNLARELPTEIWKEYDDRYGALAERIRQNINGELRNLPKSFVESWIEFMDKHGYDGTDQLFVSSPRHHEQPELLLAKLRHNIGNIRDPAQVAQEKLAERRRVQDLQLAAAGIFRGRIVQRNLYLENICWLRNAPKLLLSQVYAAVRTAVLACEAKLLSAGRLDQAGDIFHLKINEVDQCLRDTGIDVRQMLGPRKHQYLRAKQAKTCPFLIDSRGRILKPNIVQSEPGVLVGAAISPGMAEGIVRVLNDPSERLEPGEVLATVLTDPAWTPVFVSCSAVILQVGGALQHGALCAREYGKPAVSGIDVINDLKTGMKVSVDGNTGVVKILDL